jgi:16S rRNA G527 N7-methylase RsmG
MFRELLADKFSAYGVLSFQQLRTLEEHYRLLLRWNETLNLTRIVGVDDAVRLHYCESLFVGTKIPADPIRILDLGSGAGFPGIPLAILRPECGVDLVESNKRKAVFLREASRGLSNVRVISDRAELIEARQWDWLVSRAVRPGEVLGLGLARRSALLMSSNNLKDLPQPGLVFNVPWGANRILAMFHVEHLNAPAILFPPGIR